ncbi:hypothetical protein C1H46_016871 [Malus baccata]|uniref:Uncharacterized protein n=1 Tax=Malus baccata TaxID=106549 RepID=A0A540MFM7_MALBA|nr:hypothetical protein C1H46_016871 [Malus baccata]
MQNQKIVTRSKFHSRILANMYKHNNTWIEGEAKRVCKIPLLWLKSQYTWPRWKSGKGIVRKGNKAGNHIRSRVLQIRAKDGVGMIYGEGRQRGKVRRDGALGLEMNGQRRGRGGEEGHEVQK